VTEKRLMDGALDGFERELLAAAKQDVIPEGRRQLLMGAMGVSGVGIASAVGVAASQGGSAAAQGGSAAQSAAAAGSKLLAGKVMIGKVGAIAGAIGAAGALSVLAAVGLSTDPQPPSPPEQAAPVTAPTKVEASPAPRTLDEAEDEKEEEEDTGKLTEVSPKKPAPSGATTTADSLTRELALIDAARRAVARGDGSGALRQLDTYSRRYPKGALRTEASVLRIEALIAKGDRAGAKRLGNAFLLRSPNGPYARRIRSLLGKGERATEP